MNIKFENIGMIENGEIILNGLTVLAGENDTGKSTIGKLLFSIIRSFGKYKEEFEEDRDDLLEEKLRLIYFELRKNVNFDHDINLRKNFDPIELMLKIQNYLKENKLNNLNKFLNDKKELIKKQEIAVESIENIISQIDEIIKAVNIDSKHIDVQKRSLNKAILSEFAYQITNFFTKNESIVIASEGDNIIFQITIKDNKIYELESHDELFYNDVTYIESPLALQFNGVTQVYSPFRYGLRRYKFLPLHVSDLLTKIQDSPFMEQVEMYPLHDLLDNEKDNITIDNTIKEIIGGNFVYKKKERDFIFKKSFLDNYYDVKLLNVATGIKAFGLIQMLLNSGVLNKRSLLIIDEPEVHLHPNWQLKYAELLVLLVKEMGLNILITSHSPYFIEAIKVFSDNFGVNRNTNFYLAEKVSKNTSKIINVTENLEKVFDMLTKPFIKLESEAINKEGSYAKQDSDHI